MPPQLRYVRNAMFELKTATPREWAENALKNFDALLLDHAACERKAAAMGISFVVKYPDRPALIEPMIRFAREELEHFQQVCRLVVERGLTLTSDTKDEYVNLIHKRVRSPRDERLLDRLLVASVVEARGHERLGLITELLTDPYLKSFYQRITEAEGRHRNFFIGLAENYFPTATIQKRLEEFLEIESQAIAAVPYRCALH